MAEERPVPGAGKPFRLEVATLNGELFSGAVTYVEVPGEGGHLGVLHGHTPLLTQVAPGALNFHTAEGEARTNLLIKIADLYRDRLDKADRATRALEKALEHAEPRSRLARRR